MGAGTLGAFRSWAWMVSADTTPALMARHGAMTKALINPAWRMFCKKLLGMTPPLIWDYFCS
jgi:hypothetical protein